MFVNLSSLYTNTGILSLLYPNMLGDRASDHSGDFSGGYIKTFAAVTLLYFPVVSGNYSTRLKCTFVVRK